MKKQFGFTLIELLVVISIIGLLASVILVSVNNARSRSRDAKRMSDMGQMIKALELFFDDYKSYPTAGGTAKLLDQVLYMTPTYLVKVPTAPVPVDTSTCQAANLYCSGANGNSYCYISNSASVATTYTITFCLGSSFSGGLQSGVHYVTPTGIK